MRMVSGITGKELTSFDIFSVLGLTIYISLNNKNSLYLIIFILVMMFTIKTREKKIELLVAIATSLYFFISESFFMSYLSFNNISYLKFLNIFTIITLCFSFLLFWLLQKDEIKDDRGNRVKKYKISVSQILYSTAIVLLFFFGGVNINNLIICLSVILGVTIYFIGSKFFYKNQSQYNLD